MSGKGGKTNVSKRNKKQRKGSANKKRLSIHENQAQMEYTGSNPKDSFGNLS